MPSPTRQSLEILPDKQRIALLEKQVAKLMKEVDKLKTAEAKRKEEDKIPHWQFWIDEWFKFYRETHNGVAPSFEDGEPSALKKLANKIMRRVMSHEKTAHTDWNYFEIQQWFRKYLGLAWKDTWLSNNWLLTNLNTKFDSIVDRNGQQSTAKKNGHNVNDLNSDLKREVFEQYHSGNGQFRG